MFDFVRRMRLPQSANIEAIRTGNMSHQPDPLGARRSDLKG